MPWRRIGERRYSSTHSLTSALDGGEWSVSCPSRFTSRERDPGTHWIGGWVGPRAILDAVIKREIPSPSRESNPRTPIVQPVAQRYTDWAVTALIGLDVAHMISMKNWKGFWELWYSLRNFTGTFLKGRRINHTKRLRWGGWTPARMRVRRRASMRTQRRHKSR
jgi:hypothetical protein